MRVKIRRVKIIISKVRRRRQIVNVKIRNIVYEDIVTPEILAI